MNSDAHKPDPPTPRVGREATKPLGGLAALAGALSHWDGLKETTDKIYASRRDSLDRPALSLD
jgi:hypothetical protein